MLALVTQCAKARLPHARVLARTFQEHHPGASVTVLLLDAPDGCLDPAAEPFAVLGLADLGLGPAEHVLTAALDASTLAAALRPALLRHALATHEQVLYLDADTRVYDPQEPIEAALSSHEIVLVPRRLDPSAADGDGSAFDPGVVAVRRGAHAEAFLEWWTAREQTPPTAGRRAVLDHAPALFEGLRVLRDRGTGVAADTVAERPLTDQGAAITAGGQPLRSVRFGDLDPDRPRECVTGEPGSRPVADAVLARLREAHAADLVDAGLREARTWPYSWAVTAGGVTLTDGLRELLGRTGGPPAASLFDIRGEQAWIAWLAEPAGDGRGPARLLAAMLDAAGPDEDAPPADADGVTLRRWARDRAAASPDVPDTWLAAPAGPGPSVGVRDISDATGVGAHRGETVVVIPLFGARDLFVRCLRSVLNHTPPGVRILIADDADPDPGNRVFVDELSASGALEHEILWLRRDENAGFVGNVNGAFAACTPADVLLLNSDCVVAAGWLERLRAAAHDDTNVATSTALTNHGTIVSVPWRNRPVPDLPQGVDFTTAARTVATLSRRLRPRIPTCIGHCVYFRRDALELIGPFDEAFAPAYGEEVDFSQRCLVHGLVHVVADDVLVLHRQGGSFGEDGEAHPVQAAHEEIIRRRYPYYARLTGDVAADANGTLSRALTIARRGFGDLSVTVDGRSLGPVLTGTQLHIVELIGALLRTEAIDLRVIVPPDLGEYARALLDHPAVRTITQDQLHPDMEKTAVVHRPFQVAHPDDLTFLKWTGERAIVTQQDLIAYRNPGYFPGYPQFARYRRMTRAALSFADAVVFFSEHARRDAAIEDFVDARRAHVVYIGVDHSVLPAAPTPRRPAGCEGLGERDVLLCLGTDFRHKNRLFALRVVEALQRRHGWDGRLVLAGARILHGSSQGDEAAFLACRPQVAEAVVNLPAIDEAEKAWLSTRATAMLYPTLYEGFGLVPFEAADHGIPALWAPHASLAEVLPVDAATLVAWDPDASADAVIEVLRDPARAAALVARVRGAAARFRWDATGRDLVELYRTTAATSIRTARLSSEDVAAADAERDELQRKYEEVLSGFTDHGRRLVGAGGLLSGEQQRVLRAALERPGPARAAFHRALSLAEQLRPPSEPVPDPEADPAALRLHWEWLNRNHVRIDGAAVDPHVLEPGPG